MQVAGAEKQSDRAEGKSEHEEQQALSFPTLRSHFFAILPDFSLHFVPIAIGMKVFFVDLANNFRPRIAIGAIGIIFSNFEVMGIPFENLMI